MPDYLKQDGAPRGSEELTLDDWAPALVKNISYDAQLIAIRNLLYRLRGHDRELDDEIKQLQEYKGPHKDHAVDEWVDLVHGSVYQGAAHSMAAVGMLAPFIESVFCGGFETIRENSLKMIVRTMRTRKHVGRAQQNPNGTATLFTSEASRGKALVEGIFQLAEAVGLHSYLPPDLKPMMEALFSYRNKMFHSGFEWPPEEGAAFKKHIVAKNWPSDWFAEATGQRRAVDFLPHGRVR